jgi:energy-converting hydrogenase A subunit R
MYSGDSITDCEAFEYAKENQGVSISFNGNIHSIKSASISITSTNNIILALMADIFNNKSTGGVYDFISSYNEDPLESIINYSGNDALTQELLLNKASIDLITEDNIEELNEKSKIVRNKVRGQKIGNLG